MKGRGRFIQKRGKMPVLQIERGREGGRGREREREREVLLSIKK